jgi:hypothetical protein
MDNISRHLVEYYKPWLVFWAAAVLCHLYMDSRLVRKWRSWSRGIEQQTVQSVDKMRVVKIWLAEVLFQRQLFGLSSFRWFIHVLIFWGFIGLSFLSISTFILRPLGYLGIDGGSTNYFLHDGGYKFIKIWGDSFGLALLVGLIVAMVRLFIIRPEQLERGRIDIILLIFLLWLTLSGFALEGLRLSLSSPELLRYSFVGRFFVPAGYHTKAQLQPWLTALWTIHALGGVSFLAYLPHSKLLHSLVAPLVISMNAAEETDRKDIYWPDIKKYRATR